MKYLIISILLSPYFLVAQNSVSLIEQWDLADEYHQNGERENSIQLYHTILDSLNSNVKTSQNDFDLAATYNKLGLALCKDFLKANKGKLISIEDEKSYKATMVLPLTK